VKKPCQWTTRWEENATRKKGIEEILPEAVSGGKEVGKGAEGSNARARYRVGKSNRGGGGGSV